MGAAGAAHEMSARGICILGHAGKSYRLLQDVEIANVIGENEHEPGIERSAGISAQAPVGLNKRDIGFVGTSET